MHKEELHKGIACKLYCLVNSGREPEFKAFMQKLQHTDRKKVLRLIKVFTDHREIWSNETKCKHLEDRIYELKPSSQIRLFIVFEPDSVVILTHGYIKKVSTNKQFQTEIQRAKRLYKQYCDESS